MYGFHSMGVGCGFGWIVGIVFLVLIIWAIVKGVEHCQHSQTKDDKSGLDILKQRFANGEINKDEYEEMKRTIS